MLRPPRLAPPVTSATCPSNAFPAIPAASYLNVPSFPSASLFNHTLTPCKLSTPADLFPPPTGTKRRETHSQSLSFSRRHQFVTCAPERDFRLCATFCMGPLLYVFHGLHLLYRFGDWDGFLHGHLLFEFDRKGLLRPRG